MKIYKLKDGTYLPEGWNGITSVELVDGRLEYFISGQGRKKTTKYTILEEDVEEPVTWLFVGRMYDKYGTYVATTLAHTHKGVSSMVADQMATGYGVMYQKVKDVLTEDFNPNFFDLLRCDYMLACFGIYSLDIIGLDEKLGEFDKEYDPKTATYKGEPCSMKEYLEKAGGTLYAKVVELALTH